MDFHCHPVGVQKKELLACMWYAYLLVWESCPHPHPMGNHTTRLRSDPKPTKAIILHFRETGDSILRPNVWYILTWFEYVYYAFGIVYKEKVAVKDQ